MEEQNNAKSSAGIISGVRAMIGGPDAAIHAHFAGRQGNKLAKKVVTAIYPELVEMIKARHISKLQFLHDWDGQIVVLGCGMDPISEYLANPERIFMLDLPPMLEKHREAIETWHSDDATAPSMPQFIACDLSQSSVIETLRAFPQFDLHKPVRIVMEGVSMYFDREQLRGIIQGMQPLIRKGDGMSGIWMDFISEKKLRGEVSIECRNWFDFVESLGERMVLGHDNPAELARSDWGFHDMIVSMKTAGNILSISSPVARNYFFLDIRDSNLHLGPPHGTK